MSILSGLNFGFRGNPRVKAFGVPVQFTEEQVQEYIKCSKDPIYFIKNYVKIISLDHGLVYFKLYPYQEKFVESLHNNRMVIGMMPRQHGKTQVVAAYLLWYTLFNDNKTVAILANKAAAAREVFSRYQLMYENLPMFLQQGVREWNKGSAELENGAKIFTASTSSAGIRGRSVNFLYVDEVAIIPNTVADEFFTATYPTISSGQTTKIALTSTPLGLNHFWKFWQGAEDKTNDFIPIRVHYTEHPDHDEKWAEDQRRLLGDLKFNQEVLCEFLGSSATLIAAQCIAQMKPKKPIYDKDNLVLFERPERGTLNSDMTWNKKPGVYAITVDTSLGVGGDANAFSIIKIDTLPHKVVGRFRDNIISPLLYPSVIYKWAKEYNDAWVLVELNKSEQVPYILQSELEYENLVYVTKDTKKGQRMTGGFGSSKSRYGVLTDKKTKRIGCSMFKTLTEENKLEIYDVDTISEISTFIESKGSYAADDGYNDDIVMTLVLFGWMASQPYFKELTDIDLREAIYNNRAAEIEQEMLPLGMFTDGNVQEGEEVWTDWNGGY